MPDTTPPSVIITSPTSDPTYTASSSPLTLAGVASDNVGVASVTWSNDRGGSGTCSGTTSWSASGIAVQNGQNVITVTAYDAAGNSSTDAITVTYVDTTPPTIAITTPTSAATYSTNQVLLNIGGTAWDDGAVVCVTWTNDRGGSGTCTGTTDWSASGIAVQPGNNAITVTAYDAGDNTASGTITVTFTDTTPPVIVITSPTINPTYSTNSAVLNIAGTAVDDVATTLVTWSSDSGAGGTCSGTSNWSATGIALRPGANVITVTACDGAGNTSTDTLTVTFTDITPPTVTITGPTSNPTYTTTNPSVNISGTASDNVGVTSVAWSNNLGGSGTCTGTTSWSASGIAVVVGANIITVTARDGAGNSSTDAITIIVPDTIPPSVAITNPTTDPNYATTTAQLSISGTASDNVGVASVSWTDDRGGTGTCAGTANWSASGIQLQVGANVISVTASDAAGNTSTSNLTVTFTDVTPPVLSITVPVSAAVYATTCAKLNIGGTASDDSSVALVMWSNDRNGSGVCAGTANWSASNIQLQPGQDVITVTAEDGSGNVTTQTLTVTFIDITPPTVTISAPTGNASYTTTAATVRLSGSATDDVGVTLVTWSTDRGNTGTCTGTSAWNTADIPITVGQNTITITASDASGNTGAAALTVIVPDTVPPTVAITLPTGNATYATSVSPLVLSGTASDNVGVVSVAWSTSRGKNGTCTGTSTWSSSGITLLQGLNTITISAKDAAGNTGTATLAVTFTDVTPPVISITSPTTDPTFDTNNAQLTIGGTASDDSLVASVSWTDDRGGSGTCTGTTAWNASKIALKPGANVITVTAKDPTGNSTSATLTVAFTDITPPSVVIMSPTANPTYDSTSSPINISGTSSDDVGVASVAWSDDRGGAGTCTGTNTWSATNLKLALGDNVITVTAKDASGNSGTTTLTVTYRDITPPAVAITSPTSSKTYTTTNYTISIGGTAADAVDVASVQWSDARGNSGSCTGTTSWNVGGIPLIIGQNVITITAKDSSGNAGTATLTVTVPDTIPPTISIQSPTTDPNYTTYSTSIDLAGTAADNISVAGVTWADDHNDLGSCNGTTSWSAAGVPLKAGQNIITVTAKDAAGNAAKATITVTLLDITPPSITITGPTTGSTYTTTSAAVNVSGTASDNIAVDSVTWASDKAGSGTATGTTSWSVNNITLVPGPNVITVTAKDSSGNTAAQTLTVTATDTTPPTVAITSPTSSATYSTSSATLAIGGTASDAFGVASVTWASDKGGSGTCSGTTTWNAAGISLQAGANCITVTAKDTSGNCATRTVTVTYTPPDTTPPVVTITTPTTSPTYSTGLGNVTIAGTASDNVGVKTVTWADDKGGSGSCTGTTSWSATIPKPPAGCNTITVTAKDAAGNAGTAVLKITISDTTPPTVTITSPTSAPTYTAASASVKLGGTASDDGSVASVTWANDKGGSGTCTGTTSWTIAAIALVIGDNHITVTATDGAGNSATASITVTYADKTAPTVQITSPTTSATYSTTSATVDIGGTAADNVAVASVGWSNDKGGSGVCSGTLIWSAKAIPLQTGTNVITVTVTDTSGNTGKSTLSVTNSGTSGGGGGATFAVSISAPSTTGAYSTANSTLDASGTVVGSTSISSVAWSSDQGGSGKCTGTTSWSATAIPLLSGTNIITVTATDSSKNTASATLNVSLTSLVPGAAWNGLAMVSMPLVPTDTDPKNVIGFYENEWIAYRPDLGGYAQYPDTFTWFEPVEQTQGRGFWAYFSTQAPPPTGQQPPQNQPFTIHLLPGWNLIGQPFTSSITWSLTAIMVKPLSGSETALKDANSVMTHGHGAGDRALPIPRQATTTWSMMRRCCLVW